MNPSTEPLNMQLAEERIEAVRSKRGYLLPHHGLLALTAPNLLDGYDACYSALTLGDRYLAEKDKEFVWLGVLAVMEEFLATQHVAKYLAAGGSPEMVSIAVRLAAFARGASAFEFADSYWRNHVPHYDGRQEYISGLETLSNTDELDKGLLHISLVAIHTSIRKWTQVEWHIGWAYECGVPETHLSEALTYSMFTGSIPNFIEGCEVWRKMITDGKVRATEPFEHWARLDQSGPS